MPRFRVDLKTFLGLAMLQCGHKVNVWLAFRWDFLDFLGGIFWIFGTAIFENPEMSLK